MNVVMKSTMLKDFDRLSVEDGLKISEALNKLKNVKSLSEATNLLKMKGTVNKFRLKVGNFRVLLEWDKQQQSLKAIAVAHRKDVYK
jgi:mRNA-degrading endonuclease RelE of RelBE toxin-antitoxin system